MREVISSPVALRPGHFVVFVRTVVSYASNVQRHCEWVDVRECEGRGYKRLVSSSTNLFFRDNICSNVSIFLPLQEEVGLDCCFDPIVDLQRKQLNCRRSTTAVLADSLPPNKSDSAWSLCLTLTSLSSVSHQSENKSAKHLVAPRRGCCYNFLDVSSSRAT